MNPQAFTITPDDYPRALNVLGIQITVLAANSATGSYEVTLQQGDEGAGPPPHSHPWDESFFVIRGNVEFSCAGKTVTARVGSLVHVPARTVHAFRFAKGGAAMIEFTGAGGGATKMFTQLAQEVPPGPPDISKLVGILQNHRVTVEA